MKYLITIEINHVEFKIHTEAGNKREAEHSMWEMIRKRTTIKSIEVESEASKSPSVGEKFIKVIKNTF